ncbi:MAG TPA: ParB/RepB/Spo0J family partition protein [Gemmataceae bacterium]|nr:ParB/RepB/Spo0J family partition protein [Gemmataceae bacterium]
MERKARLGRGLDALLSGTPEGGDGASVGEQAQVAVDQIEQNPYQPRKAFDDEELASLSASIKTHGVLQPLVVRRVGEGYQLIAGERRLRAARAAGMAAVPVRVVDFNDQQVLEAALVENIHRADLNPIEKAQGFKEYLARFEMTHDDLAKRLGLARPTITNLVGLLELPAEVQDMVRVGSITLGHAKILKGITDRERQLALCKEVIALGLSVHALEGRAKQPAQSDSEKEPAAPKPPAEKTAHVQGIEDELRQKLALKVEIRVRGKDKGQIVLAFESNDDFERLLEVLRR